MMKKLYVLGFLLLIITVHAFAQAGRVFNLDKLSKRDTLLSGWKFQAGDNASRARPDFDDSHWGAADPGVDVTHFKELKDAGIAWIRVHIRVDSSLANRTLAITVSQFTASEIYLNGTPIARYGKVNADPAKVRGYLTSKEPFIIKLVTGKDNIIAVRLSYQRNVPYISSLFEQLPAFALHVNDYPSAMANYYIYRDSIKNFILVFALFGGAILIVFFIHIVYFLVDRSKRVNLYYALFCLSICYITLPNEIWGVERFGNLATQMWMVYTQGSFFIVGMLFLLLTIFALFNYPHRRVFTALSLIGLAMIIYMYSNGTTAFFINTSILPLILMIEGFHVCFWAIKHKIKDASLILLGLIPFITFLTIGDLLDQNTLIAQILWGLSLVCFPLGMSFYLGIQSAFTNKQLVSTLNEVQALSARNLAQEQEKQQILANQNIILEKQVSTRTAELNQSLTNLKATQTQLIQSEKMASLGELTAGIAHEIQNPLNFVNNFSEVSAELLEELKQEAKEGHTEDVIEIANDLTKNLEKITHHGKRADAIVKGMLQHSQSGSGTKELTNINTLADEYLRLAYHGLRANDKSFNADLVTNYDEQLPKVNVIPQDVGRVLLNLFNNAFYAVNQKQKTAGVDYKPEISVATSSENGQVVIKVKDNGIGIPDAIKEKIMQPFFTTKPAGEGTGLGLSLTYDMVVKGHGGSIQVESTEGQGSEFIIILHNQI